MEESDEKIEGVQNSIKIKLKKLNTERRSVETKNDC